MRPNASCFALPASALALAACVAPPADGNADAAPPLRECVAAPGQQFIGMKATAAVGANLLEATGAAKLRWVPPRTAVTMDFQADRLTVSYDDDMVIVKVSCT